MTKLNDNLLIYILNAECGEVGVIIENYGKNNLLQLIENNVIYIDGEKWNLTEDGKKNVKDTLSKNNFFLIEKLKYFLFLKFC